MDFKTIVLIKSLFLKIAFVESKYIKKDYNLKNDMAKGSLIVLSGSDGAGKKTQTDRLYNLAADNNYPVQKLRFPRYESPTGKVVRDHLDGRFGSLEEIKPEAAAMWFAADRFSVRDEIVGALEKGINLILDRYTPDNLAHQGSKYKGSKRIELIMWIQELEYKLSRLPKPDLTLCLHLPTRISEEAVTARGEKKDLHESNQEYLSEVEKTFLLLADIEQNYKIFDCMQDGKRLPEAEVTEGLWKLIQPVLKK